MSATPDDTTLMAYADGELDAAQRRDIELALAADPALQARVRQHQALRQRLAAAFDADLAEPVPERLRQALDAAARRQAPAPAVVLDLDAARAARAAAAAPVAPRSEGWARWGGMAASLALGLVLGSSFWGGRGAAGPGFVADGARLQASGAVAQALDSQPSGSAGAALTVALSFVDRQGQYCRAFVLPGHAGLACREDGRWAVATLVAQPPVAAGALRQAASALPPPVLQGVDERIAGSALDAAAEKAALARGWRR